MGLGHRTKKHPPSRDMAVIWVKSWDGVGAKGGWHRAEGRKERESIFKTQRQKGNGDIGEQSVKLGTELFLLADV